MYEKEELFYVDAISGIKSFPESTKECILSRSIQIDFMPDKLLPVFVLIDNSLSNRITSTSDFVIGISASTFFLSKQVLSNAMITLSRTEPISIPSLPPRDASNSAIWKRNANFFWILST